MKVFEINYSIKSKNFCNNEAYLLKKTFNAFEF